MNTPTNTPTSTPTDTPTATPTSPPTNTPTLTASLVINEVDYDQPGSDTAEFIEIKNISAYLELPRMAVSATIHM
jgi:hypothetical protein